MMHLARKLQSSRVLLYGLCLAAAALLAWRAARFAAVPDFRLELVRHFGTAYEAEGLRLLRPVPSGSLELSAVRVSPGHEAFGPYRLGPSTFLALTEPRVEFRGATGETWRLTAGVARLRQQQLEFPVHPVFSRPGEPERALRRARVELETGRIELEE